MKLGFLLAKTDLELSKEEVLAVVPHHSSWLHGNFLVVEPTGDVDLEYLQKRLAYTFSIHDVLFSCPKSEALEKIKSYPWQTLYRENFSARVHHLTIFQKYVHNTDEETTTERADNGKIFNTGKTITGEINEGETITRGENKENSNETGSNGCNENGNNGGNEKVSNGLTGIGKENSELTEKKVASIIWHALKDPIVKLRDPATAFHFFLYGDYAVATRQLTNDFAEFEKRRPHLRSFAYSGSMHPRLCRAIVNLLGAQAGEKVLDPCCGSGGLLIEAGLMGLEGEGYDINRIMVWGTIRNMAQQKLSDYQVSCKDALSLTGKWDYIVCDLPYGLNSVAMSREKRVSMKREVISGKKDLEEFYFSFFKKLKEILGKRAVIVMPHFVDYRQMFGEVGLRIEKEFNQYVHKNLTRKIVVLGMR